MHTIAANAYHILYILYVVCNIWHNTFGACRLLVTKYCANYASTQNFRWGIVNLLLSTYVQQPCARMFKDAARSRASMQYVRRGHVEARGRMHCALGPKVCFRPDLCRSGFSRCIHHVHFRFGEQSRLFSLCGIVWVILVSVMYTRCGEVLQNHLRSKPHSFPSRYNRIAVKVLARCQFICVFFKKFVRVFVHHTIPISLAVLVYGV